MDLMYYKDLMIGKIRNYVYPYLPAYYEASQITDNILISNLSSVYNVEEMKKAGITHIINTVLAIDPAYPKEFKYLNIDTRDSVNEDLKQYFDESYEFIEDAVNNGGNVIVHCAMGISRSSTIVIAYLIRKERISYERAYEMVKEKRNIIEPNEGFKLQLREYAVRWGRKKSRLDI